MRTHQMNHADTGLVSANPPVFSHSSSGSSSSRARLTIWTILRDFTLDDPFASGASFGTQVEWLEALHTYNAINSWMRLPNVRVILFGSDVACRFVATFVPASLVTCEPIPCVNAEFNVRIIIGRECLFTANVQTPQYDCLFARAAELATSEFLMYSNSDMVYFEDLLWAAHTV